MPTNPMTVQVTVSDPPRGGGAQTPVSYMPKACEISVSWGLQPATAVIDWVSATAPPAILPGALTTIQMGGHIFWGFSNEVTKKSGSDGQTLMKQFVDLRAFLQWDQVYGLFNQRENRLVNGVFLKRYWHILPQNYATYTKTYTNSPYTALDLLDFLFNAPTVKSPWIRYYHEALDVPVYDVNVEGVFLGTAVLGLTERCGCVFSTTEYAPYELIWTLKGIGTVPSLDAPGSFPPNSDNRRSGQALSGNPTAITVLGGRSQYQVLNLELAADWYPGWADFFDVDIFADDLFDNEATEAAIGGIPAGTPYNAIPNDDDEIIGRQLAKARALTITVGQYADLRDLRDGNGALYRDTRKYNSRSRLGMPAAL